MLTPKIPKQNKQFGSYYKIKGRDSSSRMDSTTQTYISSDDFTLAWLG